MRQLFTIATVTNLDDSITHQVLAVDNKHNRAVVYEHANAKIIDTLCGTLNAVLRNPTQPPADESDTPLVEIQYLTEDEPETPITLRRRQRDANKDLLSLHWINCTTGCLEEGRGNYNIEACELGQSCARELDRSQTLLDAARLAHVREARLAHQHDKPHPG